MPRIIIAISGFCRSGKNSFANVLQKELKDSCPNLKVEQFSFANALRIELDDFINHHFNISPWTEDEKEKEIIRPLLIAHGNAKRQISENQYWIKKIDEKIERSDCDVALITDLRYCESDKDEVQWVKSKKGLIFHIKRYVKKGNQKVFQSAPNEFEKRNNSLLEKNADIVYKLPMTKTKEEFLSILKDESFKLLHYFL